MTRMIRNALMLTMLSLGLLILYHCNPETTAWFPKCVIYRFTGLYCPGCGTARAVFAMLHGDVIVSLCNQILLFPAVVLCVAMIIKPRLMLNQCLCWGTFAVICIYGIIRNLPWKPFSYLAPMMNN